MNERLSAENWNAAAELFEQALDLPSAQRSAWLDANCPDPSVRALVFRMLEADGSADPLVDGDVAPYAALVEGSRPPELEPGTRIDDYELGDVLGRGGMGIVYRARDVQLERSVALKFFAGAGRPEAVRDRQLAEARAAARLDHPAVGAIYRVGETPDGALYLAMPLYEGETLRERLRRGPLAVVEAQAIARQVASGLAAAHAADIVHRDVKPENVFLTEEGPTKLLDFGVAASLGSPSRGGSSGGTTAYLSPEHLAGADPDPRDDVWALGLTILEAVTGENPVVVGGMPTTRRHIATLRTPPEIPAELRRTRLGRALAGALEPAPGDRLADGAAFLRALGGADAAMAPAAWWRRALALAAAAAVLVVALLALAGGDDAGVGPSAASAAEPAVLVLPFDLPSGGPAGDTAVAYLRTIFPEEVAARLREFDGLGVRSARGLPIGDHAAGVGPELAAELGRKADAEFAMRGRIGTRDGATEVSAELVRVSDGESAWSSSYAADAEGLQNLERALASDIAAFLGAARRPPADGSDPDAGPSGSGTEHPRAYEHYLRGNHFLSLRSPEDVRQAMDEYERAVALDREFTTAAVRKAYAAVVYADWGWEFPGRTATELLSEARATTDAVIARDSLHPEAWLTRAYVESMEHPDAMNRAVEPYRRALALDPGNAEAHHQYGQALMALGRYDEAVRAYRNALALEPGRGMTVMAVGAVFEAQGRMDQSIVWLDSAVSLAPDFSYIRATRAGARARLGDAAGALHDAERAMELHSDGIPERSAYSVALRANGRIQQADEQLGGIVRELQSRLPSATDALYAGGALTDAGRAEEALALLQRVRPRGGFLWFYLDKAEFTAALDSAGLMSLSDEAWPDSSRPPPER